MLNKLEEGVFDKSSLVVNNCTNYSDIHRYSSNKKWKEYKHSYLKIMQDLVYPEELSINNYKNNL